MRSDFCPNHLAPLPGYRATIVPLFSRRARVTAVCRAVWRIRCGEHIVIDELVACPRCNEVAGVAACRACGARFPSLGGVPVLLVDAEAAVRRWRVRVREFGERVDEGIRRTRAELGEGELLASTRSRIERTCDALADNRARVLALLSEAGLPPANDETAFVGGSHSGAGHGAITEYYELLHRDWAWEDADENRHACEAVGAALGDGPGLTVVLGAGACRLAHDLVEVGATVVAVDINPLLAVVAKRVTAGETIELYEFPLIPRDIEVTSVLRSLRAPRPRELTIVLADAFRLPFVAGRVDTVVTPWFIDQVPSDVDTFLPVVHRLLRPGGRWIHHGPLIYPKGRPARTQYTPTELVELTERAGFEVVSCVREMRAFLRSPANAFARIEQVITLAAKKKLAAV